MTYTYIPRTLAQAIASTAGAYHRCVETHNDYADKHKDTLVRAERLLPSGGGLDRVTNIALDKSSDERIVLTTSFHHMNENGVYDGWTEHTVTVRPSFSGLNILISGRDRNDIKDYLHDVFDTALSHVLTRAEWFEIHGVPDPDQEDSQA